MMLLVTSLLFCAHLVNAGISCGGFCQISFGSSSSSSSSSNPKPVAPAKPKPKVVIPQETFVQDGNNCIDPLIWGVNSADDVFYYDFAYSKTTASTKWQYYPYLATSGPVNMKNVAGGGGEVWATDSADEVYKLKVDQSGYPISAFQKQPGDIADQISVGNANHIWITDQGRLFKWNSESSSFVLTFQSTNDAKQVDVGCDGEVWTVSQNGDVYRLNQKNNQLEKMVALVGNSVKYLSVGKKGQVWCLDSSDNVYYWSDKIDGWSVLEHSHLKQIDVSIHCTSNSLISSLSRNKNGNNSNINTNINTKFNTSKSSNNRNNNGNNSNINTNINTKFSTSNSSNNRNNNGNNSNINTKFNTSNSSNNISNANCSAVNYFMIMFSFAILYSNLSRVNRRLSSVKGGIVVKD
eukprot:Pgem_evm1s78